MWGPDLSRRVFHTDDEAELSGLRAWEERWAGKMFFYGFASAKNTMFFKAISEQWKGRNIEHRSANEI